MNGGDVEKDQKYKQEYHEKIEQKRKALMTGLMNKSAREL